MNAARKHVTTKFGRTTSKRLFVPQATSPRRRLPTRTHLHSPGNSIVVVIIIIIIHHPSSR